MILEAYTTIGCLTFLVTLAGVPFFENTAFFDFNDYGRAGAVALAMGAAWPLVAAVLALAALGYVGIKLGLFLKRKIRG